MRLSKSPAVSLEGDRILLLAAKPLPGFSPGEV